MALLPLYSRRKRQRAATGSDVFQYSEIPRNVRVQIMMNMDGALNSIFDSYRDIREEVYSLIASEMKEELGTHKLTLNTTRFSSMEVTEFFHDVATLDQTLDVLELWHLATSKAIELQYVDGDKLTYFCDRINARLLEAGIGFELVDGQIIEKSNEYVHSETVLPALHVLAGERFSGANEEFREAHNAYRAGEYEDCLTDCLKALESVIKVIASERGWTLHANPTARHLIDALFENELVPSYMANQFAGLRSMLEGSVPTTRNRSSGHGRGAEKREIPQSLAAFQLHQTAAIIVFLAELDR